MDAVIRQFPLAAGIAEGSDPKQLPPGTLLSCINGVWKKEGRVDKRFGTLGLTKNIAGGGTLASAGRLMVRGGELVLTDRTNLYAYRSTGWVNRGRHPEVGLRWSTALDTVTGVKSFDTTILSDGQVVQAWVTGDPTDSLAFGDVVYQIKDASGVVVAGPTKVDTAAGWRIRLLSSGTTWVLLWMKGGNLKFQTSGATGNLQTNAMATVFVDSMDACVIGSEFVVAYALAAGGISLRRYSFAATPALQASGAVTGEASATITAITVGGAAGETLYVAWGDPTAVRIRSAAADPSTLAQTVAPFTVDTDTGLSGPILGIVRETSTTCLLAYSFSSQSWYSGVLRTASITNAGVATACARNAFLRLLSRPFLLGSRFYVAAGTDPLAIAFTSGGGGAILGADAFLLDATNVGAAIPSRQVGKLDATISGAWCAGYASEAAIASASRVTLSLPYQSTLGSNQSGWRQGARAVQATIGAELPADMWRSVTLGQETYITAGVLTSYDGVEALGYGWPHGPYIDVLNTTPSAAGGNMATGNYLYNVTPERRSNAGVLHRGPIGNATKVAVTGPTGKVTLCVVPVWMGASLLSSGLFAAYRSLVGATTLHRLTIEPTYQTLFNNSFASTPLALTDVRADSNVGGAIALSTRPALYTEGGELEDMQPSGCTSLAYHQNRLWVLAGDGRSVWPSKDATENPDTAPGFHPTMRIVYPEDIVAIASMDEKFIAFSATRPYYVLGNGPAPDGSQSDFTPPIPVVSDVGCASPRSVVLTTDGIMFVSARGFTVLTRGLEVVFVGRPVQDTLAAFPVVTSAVLVPDQNQVRWTCNNAAGTAGRVIVFDYLTKQWAVFSYWDADASVAGTPFADALLWNGVWTFVTPGGKVYREDATTFLDNGATWVKQSGELAWLSEGGPLGFQHIRRAFLLGDRYTDCDLTLKFGFNHKAAYPQSYTWASDKLAQFGDGANIGMRVGSQNGASPRCRAFRAAWEDAPPTGAGAVVGTGQGVNLSAFGMEFLPKPHMDRRGARART